jgi:hypothetical protein
MTTQRWWGKAQILKLIDFNNISVFFYIADSILQSDASKCLNLCWSLSSFCKEILIDLQVVNIFPNSFFVAERQSLKYCIIQVVNIIQTIWIFTFSLNF